jgi:molybdate transport system substrate-binding protein
MFRPFLYALLSALVSFSSVRTVSAQQEPVTAFAAASLFEALNSIGKTFTNQSGVAVRFSFASSAVLAKQIEHGAPADVFASADVEWMDWAQARNLIKPQTRIDLLGNNLVIVAPSSAKFSTIQLTREALSEAIGQGRIATGEVNSVPAGIYAKAALEKLGLWNALSPRLAQSENVRAALALVARQEATLGIVYGTSTLAAQLSPRRCGKFRVADGEEQRAIELDPLLTCPRWEQRQRDGSRHQRTVSYAFAHFRSEAGRP